MQFGTNHMEHRDKSVYMHAFNTYGKIKIPGNVLISYSELTDL